MNTPEVITTFMLGFVSALPVALLFAAAMRPRKATPESQKMKPILPDAITVDGRWQKYEVK